MQTEPSIDERPSGQPTSTGTLFCVSCPYQGRFDGGWTVVETDDCPSCGDEVMTRYRPAADANDARTECTGSFGGMAR